MNKEKQYPLSISKLNDFTIHTIITNHSCPSWFTSPVTRSCNLVTFFGHVAVTTTFFTTVFFHKSLHYKLQSFIVIFVNNHHVLKNGIQTNFLTITVRNKVFYESFSPYHIFCATKFVHYNLIGHVIKSC